MASMRALTFSGLIALGAAGQLGQMDSRLLSRNDFGTPQSCSNPQTSCQNSSAVSDLCCFVAPGGSLLQVQLWDTDPVTGPADSWTIHGLWPDKCNGDYSENCDSSRAYTNITQILDSFGDSSLVSYMNEYWQSNDESPEKFWEHEWSTHGTCINTLDPSCYSDYQPQQEVADFFNIVVTLFKSLPTYDWLSEAGITPSSSKTYSASDIQSALSAKNGGVSVYLDCDDDEISSIYYYFNVQGSVQTGKFIPTNIVGDSGSCPDDGIKYLPKKGASNDTSTSRRSLTKPAVRLS